MSSLAARTVGSIVADDFRTAAVFSAHGIDFCCKGGRTLAEACRAHGLDSAAVEGELRKAAAGGAPGSNSFTQWSVGRLIEHIERVHHRYVEGRTATLLQLLSKLCKVHGERHGELFELQREFQECAAAMAAHMRQEEVELFPYINRLEKLRRHGERLERPSFGTVEGPIAAMERDHEAEGERFRRMAALSQGYAVPRDGCAAYRAAMAMLKEFEEDLHRHIHLENNILFPQARRIERELQGR